LVAGRRGRQFDPGSFWGLEMGPNPTDWAKLGSKPHLICDGRGVPLAIQLTGANRNDSQQAFALVDVIPSFESGDAHGIVLTAYWATAVTTPRQSGEVCVPATSSLFWRSATPNMAADSGDGAGWSNGPSFG
jgi:hypothetical protein